MAAFFVVLLFVSVEYFIRDLPIDTFFYSLRRHSLRFSDGILDVPFWLFVCSHTTPLPLHYHSVTTQMFMGVFFSKKSSYLF